MTDDFKIPPESHRRYVTRPLVILFNADGAHIYDGHTRDHLASVSRQGDLWAYLEDHDAQCLSRHEGRLQHEQPSLSLAGLKIEV